MARYVTTGIHAEKNDTFAADAHWHNKPDTNAWITIKCDGIGVTFHASYLQLSELRVSVCKALDDLAVTPQEIDNGQK